MKSFAFALLFSVAAFAQTPPEIVCDRCPIKTADPDKQYVSDMTGEVLREITEGYDPNHPPYFNFTPEELYQQALKNEKAAPKARARMLAAAESGEAPSICNSYSTRCDPPPAMQGNTITLATGTKVTAGWTIVTPFDAPVKFGGEIPFGSDKYWQWVKTGEPAQPCTQAQATDKAAYQWGCTRKIGEVMFVSQRFVFSTPRRLNRLAKE